MNALVANSSGVQPPGETSVSEIPASPTRRFFIDENSQTSLRHFGERLNAAKPQDVRLFCADDGSFRITRLSQKANPDGSPVEPEQAFVELWFVNDRFSSERMRGQGDPYELVARNSTGYRFAYLRANKEARASWPTLLEFIRKEVTSLVQSERIVVVGQIDFDGDGQSDREQFSCLLNDARTAVDVEMEDDGHLRLNYDKIYRQATRFLVLGNIDKIANKKARAQANALTKHMIRHARELNIRIVNLSDYLAYVRNPAMDPVPAKIDQ